VPTGTGTVRLVPPGSCTPPCSGTALSSVQISGARSFAPFTLDFGTISLVPFAPSGAYTVFGATFPASTGATGGCPTVGFTVAAGLTTTLSFAITNDACTIAVAGPA
jgi:hypothetical protein